MYYDLSNSTRRRACPNKGCSDQNIDPRPEPGQYVHHKNDVSSKHCDLVLFLTPNFTLLNEYILIVKLKAPSMVCMNFFFIKLSE